MSTFFSCSGSSPTKQAVMALALAVAMALPAPVFAGHKTYDKTGGRIIESTHFDIS
jgi:hypothetical protein